MSLRGFLIALSASVVLACPPNASAALRSPPESLITEGPTLVGSAVAWEDAQCVDGCDPEDTECTATYRQTLRVASPGRRTRRLFPRLQGCGGIYSTALASPGFAALRTGSQLGGSNDQYQSEIHSSAALIAGRWDRPSRTVYRCSDDPDGPAVDPEAAVALSNSLLAWEQACPAAHRLIVRNLATGRQLQLPLTADRIDSLKFEGPWLARATASAIDLFDARTGDLRTHVPTAAAGVGLVGLGPDGTLVFASNRSCAVPPSALRPGDSAPRRLPVRSCGTVQPMAGGYAYRDARDRQDIRFLDQASGRSRTVAHTFKLARDGAFDAANGRVAFATPACDGGTRFAVVSVSRRTTVRAPRCPVDSGETLIDRAGGRVVAFLRCPDGCTGFVRVRAAGRVTAFRAFELGPSHRAKGVPILLGRKTRLRLRDGLAASSVRLTALTYDARGRRHSTRLRAPRPVQLLPGGASPARYLYRSPTIAAAGRDRPLRMCSAALRSRDETTGLPYRSSLNESDSDYVDCLRRSPALRAVAFTVRAPREARRVEGRLGRGATRTCRRTDATRWRCRVATRGAGTRPRVRLVVRYPWQSAAGWTVRFAP